MARVKIPNTTLVSVNCVSPQAALCAMERTLERCEFGRAVLLSHIPLSHDRVEIVEISSLRSKAEYSHFILKSLFEHVHTDFCLIVQPDGFVLNERAWKDKYFAFDYIGAPWELHFDYTGLHRRNMV